MYPIYSPIFNLRGARVGHTRTLTSTSVRVNFYDYKDTYDEYVWPVLREKGLSLYIFLVFLLSSLYNTNALSIAFMVLVGCSYRNSQPDSFEGRAIASLRLDNCVLTHYLFFMFRRAFSGVCFDLDKCCLIVLKDTIMIDVVIECIVLVEKTKS